MRSVVRSSCSRGRFKTSEVSPAGETLLVVENPSAFSHLGGFFATERSPVDQSHGYGGYFNAGKAGPHAKTKFDCLFADGHVFTLHPFETVRATAGLVTFEDINYMWTRSPQD